MTAETRIAAPEPPRIPPADRTLPSGDATRDRSRNEQKEQRRRKTRRDPQPPPPKQPPDPDDPRGRRIDIRA